MQTIVDLAVDVVVPGDNDRTEFDVTRLQELAGSIAADGLAQPITVRPLPAGTYQIVAGERRFRAVRLLGWPTISAIVRQLTDEQADAIMLIENVHRADLNPLEEARAYRKRIDRYGWTVAQAARKAKKSQHHVAARLLLLDLVDDVQRLIATGNLVPGFGEIMAPLDVNRQMLALRWLNDQKNPLMREFRVVCGELLAQQAQESLFDIDAYLAQAVAQHTECEQQRRDRPFPVHPALPPFERCGSLGASMEAYIGTLQALGLREAALIAGTIYQGMLLTAFCHPPRPNSDVNG